MPHVKSPKANQAYCPSAWLAVLMTSVNPQTGIQSDRLQETTPAEREREQRSSRRGDFWDFTKIHVSRPMGKFLEHTPFPQLAATASWLPQVQGEHLVPFRMESTIIADKRWAG